MNTSATAIIAGRRLIGRGCPKRALSPAPVGDKRPDSLRRAGNNWSCSDFYFATAPIYGAINCLMQGESFFKGIKEIDSDGDIFFEDYQ